ncbi:hypothetical protein G6F62_015542 [Rhizopus arrhizus]|nr:hypothetical protein G6F62_015542 [Rhizopus arrhizus]
MAAWQSGPIAGGIAACRRSEPQLRPGALLIGVCPLPIGGRPGGHRVGGPFAPSESLRPLDVRHAGRPRAGAGPVGTDRGGCRLGAQGRDASQCSRAYPGDRRPLPGHR